jgi:S-formylglutathione hydrolase FrmB
MLHGLSDTYTSWVERGGMQTVADELIGTGELREVVIIMPNAGGPDIHNTWNGYFNMPGWNYEDFFFKEFLPQVERKYRIISDKGHRAVMGLSMGGGGSTVYCQRHPDMFSSCYAMSAWLENKQGQVGGKDLKKDKLYYVSNAVNEHSALAFIDNADDATLQALRTVKWFFDCGDDDFLVRLSFELHMKMKEKGVKSELRVRNGVHNWEYWHTALRTALPYASRNFDK